MYGKYIEKEMFRSQQEQEQKSSTTCLHWIGKLAEAVSSGSMLFSILPRWKEFPFLCATYGVHFLVRMFYHLMSEQSVIAYDCDTTMMDIFINERIATTTAPMAIYLFSIATNIYFSSHPLFHNHLFPVIKAIVGSAIYIVVYRDQPDIYYYASICFSILCCYVISTMLKERRKQEWGGIVFCILYHLMLGPYSKMEEVTNYYPIAVDVLRFMSWLSYGYHFFVRRLRTTEKFRIQSILSLITSSVLAPFGILETLSFFFGYDLEKTLGHRRHVHTFYIAYTVTDTLYGNIYYPDFFPLLEGWCHHGITMIYTLYNLITQQLRPCSVSMIVEVPTIILCASRVWKDNQRVKWMRRRLFPPFFILFRIVLLTLVTMGNYYHNGEGDVFLLVMWVFFTTLNLYWISLILFKPKRTG